MISEKNLEQKLRNEIKKLGGVALKFISPGHAGVSDRIVLMPNGKIWFAEIKRPGQKLSPLQVVFKKQTDRLGFENWLIDSEEKLVELLNEIKTVTITNEFDKA